MEQNYWKKCSACKKEIPFSHKYYQCSVSTCQGKRTGLQFCSVSCWERHLPGARHKNAGAIEKHSPSKAEFEKEQGGSEASQPQRRIIRSQPASAQGNPGDKAKVDNHEVLIVASKLKQYIKDVSGMNTSQSVLNVLSDMVRRASQDAIDRAREDGRKTVLDRDFK